jgi:hypothetical protein
MHINKENNEEQFLLIFSRKNEKLTVTSVGQCPFKPIQYYLKKQQHFLKLSNDNDATVIFFKMPSIGNDLTVSFLNSVLKQQRITVTFFRGTAEKITI